MAQGALVCPGCGSRHGEEERFCPDCSLPLVFPGGDAVREPDERHEWARKIKPQLAEGELVRVAWARNQVEAEFIQGLLLEEGVPSMLKRSRGFDVPDFLAAGPRDVFVPSSGAPTAREMLLQAELIQPGGDATSPAGGSAPTQAPLRILAGLLVALIVGALIVWLLATVLR
ncbi:MAG TPA: hypothetical protein VG410_05070 [Solirubrobacteraceae bacterium]|jgi:hypothetical protein|nr:hypothetical protein [Solirubrobacteraceae bacterium]